MEGNFLRVVFIATNVDVNDEKVKNGAGAWQCGGQPR